jgi:hypothetical protein
MAKQGRPTKYKPEYDQLAYNYCKLGATDEDLAKLFTVNKDTINEWKRVHISFSDSLKKGKDEFDTEVIERSLRARAVGYSHPEIKIATHEGMITDEKEYTKHYAPDTTACIFWLKNRQPQRWRDKQEVEHSGNVGWTVNIAGFNDTKKT